MFLLFYYMATLMWAIEGSVNEYQNIFASSTKIIANKRRCSFGSAEIFAKKEKKGVISA